MMTVSVTGSTAVTLWHRDAGRRFRSDVAIIYIFMAQQWIGIIAVAMSLWCRKGFRQEVAWYRKDVRMMIIRNSWKTNGLRERKPCNSTEERKKKMTAEEWGRWWWWWWWYSGCKKRRWLKTRADFTLFV